MRSGRSLWSWNEGLAVILPPKDFSIPIACLTDQPVGHLLIIDHHRWHGQVHVAKLILIIHSTTIGHHRLLDLQTLVQKVCQGLA
jgi:hypothetical protein